MDTHRKKTHMLVFTCLCHVMNIHRLAWFLHQFCKNGYAIFNIWIGWGSGSVNPLSRFACQWSCQGQACLALKCTPGHIGRVGSQGPQPPFPQPGTCPAFPPHAPQAFHSFSSPGKQVSSEVWLSHAPQRYLLTENLSRRALPGNSVIAGTVLVMVVMVVVSDSDSSGS